MNGARPVDVARFGLGVAALATPDTFLRLTQSEEGPLVQDTVRILGARYVLQSGAGLVIRRPWIRAADAGVDLIHAVTMVALAVARPQHRRLALISAAAATAFAVVDLRERSGRAPARRAR